MDTNFVKTVSFIESFLGFFQVQSKDATSTEKVITENYLCEM